MNTNIHPKSQTTNTILADYKQLSNSFGQRYYFRIGSGRGFCAEMIHILKVSQFCLASNIQFCLVHSEKPKGYAIHTGWEDYFVAVFPVKLSWLQGILNRAHFPFGRWPILESLSRILLKLAYGRNNYFMFDQLQIQNDHVNLNKLLSIKGDYWQSTQTLVDTFWNYNEDVSKHLNVYKANSQINLDADFIGVHIRRGDKITEAPYSETKKYADTILSNKRLCGLPIYLATDDTSVFNEFRTLLETDRKIVCTQNQSSTGYDQIQFNKKPNSDRWNETVFFLFELEVLKNSTVFIGASPSNVFYWLRYLRANKMIIDVESSNNTSV